MPRFNGQYDISDIRSELGQIIIGGLSDDDLRSIPDDVPILDLGISSTRASGGDATGLRSFRCVGFDSPRDRGSDHHPGTLALYIEQELNSQYSLKKSQITQWKAERQTTLAPSQQHLGFLSRYSNEASAAFNEALVLQLNGALHGPALHAALEEAANRYESLRTALNPDQNTLDVGTGETLELVVCPVASEQLQEKLTESAREFSEPGSTPPWWRAPVLRSTAPSR